MFKRIALTLTFIAAFSMVGLSLAPSAEAWRYWGRPYASNYYGPPRAYYRGYAPYRTYYGSPYRAYYGSPYVVAPRVYRSYYAPPYYYAPGPGFSVSVGY